jgi:hypothetical protein
MVSNRVGDDRVDGVLLLYSIVCTVPAVGMSMKSKKYQKTNIAAEDLK